MWHRFSRHALDEMARRGIGEDAVAGVLRSPEQGVPGYGGKMVYQSRVDFGGRTFLVRVVVAHDTIPPTVVTVYRTSNIGRYWQEP